MLEEQTVQNCAEFEPNQQMTRWFTKAVELHTMSVSKIADSLGLHRNTFYYWLKTPGFKDWWQSMISSYFHTVYLQLIGIGLRMSQNDYRYWHDLLEHISSRVDFPQPTKTGNQIEIMAAAFFKSSTERGIDLTENVKTNGKQIDNLKL
jgi:hypothetical protein